MWSHDRGDDVKERRACEAIVTAIRRHVDDVEDARVKWDVRYVCGFCGYESELRNDWECCDASVAEHDGTPNCPEEEP